MPATLHLDWDLPDGALDEPFRTDLVRTIQREVAIRLFADGKISSGYGAQMLGVTRRDFIDMLRESKIPLFSYAAGELDQELTSVNRLMSEAKQT